MLRSYGGAGEAMAVILGQSSFVLLVLISRDMHTVRIIKKVNRSTVKGSYSTLLILSNYRQATVKVWSSNYLPHMVLVLSSYCQSTVLVQAMLLVYFINSVNGIIFHYSLSSSAACAIGVRSPVH